MRYGENLLRRGDRWFFRCRVPMAMVSLVGRRELVYALRTSNRGVARYIAAVIRLGMEQQRRDYGRMALDGEPAPLHVIVETIRRRFEAQLDEAFRRYTAMLNSPGYDPGLQRASEDNAIEVLADDAARRDLSSFMDAAVSTLHQVGYKSDDTDQRARVLARHLMECASLLAEARGHWIDGDESFRPKLPPLPADLSRRQ